MCRVATFLNPEPQNANREARQERGLSAPHLCRVPRLFCLVDPRDAFPQSQTGWSFVVCRCFISGIDALSVSVLIGAFRCFSVLYLRLLCAAFCSRASPMLHSVSLLHRFANDPRCTCFSVRWGFAMSFHRHWPLATREEEETII